MYGALASTDGENGQDGSSPHLTQRMSRMLLLANTEQLLGVRYCSMSFQYIQSSPPCELGAVAMPSLQMKKLRQGVEAICPKHTLSVGGRADGFQFGQSESSFWAPIPCTLQSEGKIDRFSGSPSFSVPGSKVTYRKPQHMCTSHVWI